MQTLLVPQPRLLIDQIPTGVYEVINQLFTTRVWSTSKCGRMLESLIRYTHVEEQTLEQHNWYVKIAIHNLLKTYHRDREMQEICCYQTLHTFVRLLSALGILTKQVSPGQPTMYLFPLDPDYRFQASYEVFVALDRLCDPGHTKNSKMRKKAREVKIRLLFMISQSQTSEKVHVFPVALKQSLMERIYTLVDSLHLSPSTTAILAQKVVAICANVLQESTNDTTSVDSAHGRREEESTRMSCSVDSSSHRLAEESTNDTTSVDSSAALPEQEDAPFEHKNRRESTIRGKNLPDVAPSSIEFLSLDRSLRGKFELESSTGEPWTGSREELVQKATDYLMLLDGPEYATAAYLNTHAGKKALGGYKNKIQRSPRLARIAAINTLMQRSFYDLTRQKKPLENAGKWFHSSFDRYADAQRPMEITGEILDWAKSPYTLQEIALVLPRERKRQETQWWSSEAPHLPFSSCVTIHQHLQDDTAALPMSVSQKQRESFRFGTARHYAETSIGLSSPQLMSFSEAEQLVEEIRREASWYLDEIHVSAEPRLGENAYVVEAFIAQTTFPVSYTCRHDWWLHHQEQVGHQIREGHNKGRTYANSPC